MLTPKAIEAHWKDTVINFQRFISANSDNPVHALYRIVVRRKGLFS